MHWAILCFVCIVTASPTGTAGGDPSWTIPWYTYVVIAFVGGLCLGMICIVGDTEVKYVERTKTINPRREDGPQYIYVSDMNKYRKVRPPREEIEMD